MSASNAPLAERLSRFCAGTRAAFQADACVIRLLEADTTFLRLGASDGVDPTRLLPDLPADDAVVAHILSQRRPLAIDDMEATPDWKGYQQPTNGYRYRSYAGIPLLADVGARAVGLLGLYSVEEQRHFTDEELDDLQIVGRVVASLVENKRLHHRRVLDEEGEEMRALLAPDGTLLAYSASVTRQMGYAPDVLVGQEVFAFVHPDDRMEAIAAQARLRRGEADTVRTLCRWQHADGSWRYLESVARYYGDDPTLVGILVIAQDVTERLQHEAQRQQEEHAHLLGNLVTGIAHEVNNPLAAASGYAQMLSLHPDTAVQTDAQAIIDLVSRASNCIQALRRYARVASNTSSETGVAGESEKTPGDLNAVVEAAVAATVARDPSVAEHIRLILKNKLPPLRMNQGEIEQVIGGLLQHVRAPDHLLTLRTRFTPARSAEIPPVLAARHPQTDWLTLSLQSSAYRKVTSVLASSPPFVGDDVRLHLARAIIAEHGGEMVAVPARRLQGRRGTEITVFLPAETEDGEASELRAVP